MNDRYKNDTDISRIVYILIEFSGDRKDIENKGKADNRVSYCIESLCRSGQHEGLSKSVSVAILIVFGFIFICKHSEIIRL